MLYQFDTNLNSELTSGFPIVLLMKQDLFFVCWVYRILSGQTESGKLLILYPCRVM